MYKMYKGMGVRFAGFIYFFLITHENDSILKWGGGGGGREGVHANP